jgi:transcriptional regulator with XRE-family HTH domain
MKGRGYIMSFVNTIRKLRDQAGLSQQDVADAVGIARATYIKLENSGREPKLDELLKLSQYYEIGLESLISGQGLKVNEPLVQYKRTSISKDADISPREIDPKVNPEKLREVLLYVLGKVGAKPNVGETVLYKLLYFIDMDYYEKHGQSITGLTYIHNTYGPSPVKDFKAVVDDMCQHDELDVIETKFFNNKQKKYLPQVESELQELSASEIKHIDAELVRLGDKNARELSDLSHKDTPWVATPPNKPIDYQLAMYRTSATTVREDDRVEL